MELSLFIKMGFFPNKEDSSDINDLNQNKNQHHLIKKKMYEKQNYFLRLSIVLHIFTLLYKLHILLS